MMQLPHAEKSTIICEVVSTFDTISERVRRTDGQTDGQNCYINIARYYVIDS